MGAIPFAKLAYSAALIAVILVFAKELHRVWRDRQTYLAAPTYFLDGKADAGKAVAFGGLVLAHHHRLTHDLAGERKERDAIPDERELFPIRAAREDPVKIPDPAQALELKIQGFDVGGLLAKLRGWVTPLNEVSIQVDSRALAAPAATLVDATISWPLAPVEGELQELRYFATPRLKSDEEAASLIAATLLWGHLREKSDSIRAVPRDEFVAWLLAWERYRNVRDLRAAPSQLPPESKALLEAAGREIEPHLARGPRFAEIWRLAANLTATHAGSIPNSKRAWEEYRDEYFASIGKSATVALARAGAAQAQAQGTGTAGIVEPGSLIWSEDGRMAVRVTAIVSLNGEKLLLLPSLIWDSTRPAATQNLYIADGQAAARAAVATIVAPDPSAAPAAVSASAPLPERSLIVLARLPPGQQASNGALKAVAKVAMGDAVRELRSGREGKVTALGSSLISAPRASALIEVQPRVTLAGDAGTPFLDGQRRLVAMGYAGGESTSALVPLAALFDQLGLKLY